MGLTKKIEEKLHKYQENRKEEKQWKEGVKQERRAEFRKGYEEGAKKTAFSKGQQNAGYYPKGKPKPQGLTGGVLGDVAGFGSGAGKGLKHVDGIFGFSGGFGLGSEPHKRSGPPVRTRTISPSGKVTITEPIEHKEHESQEWDPWGMGGAPAKKKKSINEETNEFWS